VGIRNAIIDPEVKKYVEFQRDELAIYNQVPHPIRKKKRVKKPLNIDKKSVREVMSEFEILNSMFDSQSITTDEKENTERILEAANLHDNSYQ